MEGERITRQSIKKAKFSWRHPRVSLHHCAEQWKCFSAPLFFISPPLSLSVSSCLLLWSSRCVRLCFSSGTADVSTTAPYTWCWGRSSRTSHRSKICLSPQRKKRREKSLFLPGWTHKIFSCFLNWRYRIQTDGSINLLSVVPTFNDLWRWNL